MSFEPVSTLEDLDNLDSDEIVQGYRDWRQGDPEPGENRGRAYWHGWMNAARDHYQSPPTWASGELARRYLERERNVRHANSRRVHLGRHDHGRGQAQPSGRD